ncbi:MAG: hypothetical protein ABSC13_08540 [Dehalococcoidia bacterium]|jgi:hypothetical protein
MKYWKIGLLMGISALALLLFGVNTRPPAAHATVMTVLTITKTNCLTLTGNVDWNGNGFIDADDGSTSLSVCSHLDDPSNLATLTRVLGGDPSDPQPSDFAKIDLDAGQVHETDGQVFVMAFVSDVAPVGFYATNGEFLASGRSNALCGPVGDPGYDFSELDCGGTGGTGVVVTEWVPNGAERGPGTFTVRQQSLEATADYTIVGEADHISLKAYDTAIQVNAPLCALFSDTPTFLESVTEPETSPLVATVTDSDGTPITGALVNWTVDDPDMARFFIPDPLRVAFTPSVDLQALGKGAPEMICGGTKTGTVKITATLTTGADVLPSNLGLDPGANVGRSASITLPVQSEPEAMTLSAVPPSLVCDGTASSNVSANLTDDANNAVVNGNLVHFSVKALGSVNPVDARSTSGAATTALTPLSGAINGVLVDATWMRHVVHGPTPTPNFTPLPPTSTPVTPGPTVGPGTPTPSPIPTSTAVPTQTPAPLITPKAIELEFVSSGLEQSTLVNCEQAPGAPTEQPGGAPAAVISPPRTGSGGSEASPWPVALPLGGFALLLVGSGLVLRRRKE